MKIEEIRRVIYLENELKKHKELALVLLIFFLIMAGLNLWQVIEYNNGLSSIFEEKYESNISIDDLNIKYDDLSEKEIEKVKVILNELQNIYLENQDSITFTKNSKTLEFKLLGQNVGNGDSIKIRYLKNEYEFRRVICHELLHTFYRGSKALEEALVEDVDDYLTCFKDTKTKLDYEKKW